MTRFQRINLGIGAAALALVACMAVSTGGTVPRSEPEPASPHLVAVP